MNSFTPTLKILLGPGPSNVSDRVLRALSQPTIGHLDPEFVELMNEIKLLLQYTFKTENEVTLPISGPGSAGMECCFSNLVEPGDSIIVCENGVFGKRMIENVIRNGGNPISVQDDWGKPVSLEKLEKALIENKDVKIVAFVHAETSTGVLSDAERISNLAKNHGCLTIMDCVTSLAGSPLFLDDWEIDAAYSGTQKCLSCVPGLSPVSFNNNALEKIKRRKAPISSWFLDINLLTGYWGDKNTKRAYHHTAPINSLYALHESLIQLKEEGLENSWNRHHSNHLYLKTKLLEINLKLSVNERFCLPQLNIVQIPKPVNDAEVRTHLLDNYQIEIGAGLGPMAGKIWRIGLMGSSSNKSNVDLLIAALNNAII